MYHVAVKQVSRTCLRVTWRLGTTEQPLLRVPVQPRQPPLCLLPLLTWVEPYSICPFVTAISLNVTIVLKAYPCSSVSWDFLFKAEQFCIVCVHFAYSFICQRTPGLPLPFGTQACRYLFRILLLMLELLNRTVILCSVFWRTANTVFHTIRTISQPISSGQGLQFLHIFINTLVCWLVWE